ncbi:hypothetical protein F7R91_13330 [Streptomyces luteolifulvus]|uniref:Uncharacterized protein n=1 Tax=Streptomyces luteolifulvus TaxID=2615112 RepID=A0A6H9V087_9ACTN|nr:hypothetical protein [Streptomyces luteolifulvus]KAB1147283.1 hypothetical protein F7R91_13330 [Streptomyces luteolifulvus]
MSVRIWGPGVGAAMVLVVTGAWVMWPADAGARPVDARLWGAVRPVIEARLVAESRGSGYGEAVPEYEARWFCRAEALELQERGDRVQAGVNTLCMEYGVHDGTLMECSGARFPQVVVLKRDADGGYRVVSREEPPDGEGYGEWTRSHFGVLASAAEDPVSSHALETAARAHFGLPADAAVGDC